MNRLGGELAFVLRAKIRTTEGLKGVRGLSKNGFKLRATMPELFTLVEVRVKAFADRTIGAAKGVNVAGSGHTEDLKVRPTKASVGLVDGGREVIWNELACP